MQNIDEIVAGYLHTAVWADGPDDLSRDASDNFGAGDAWFNADLFSPATLARARELVEDFVLQAEDAFPGCVEQAGERSFGGDVYLSCAGHGAGFFDRGYYADGYASGLQDLARHNRNESMIELDDAGLICLY